MKVGCDIVENKRLIDKSQKFLDLVLTKKEQELYKQKGLLFLCGRFAAKEAIMKCMPNIEEFKFTDIEILNDEKGKPYSNIDGIDVSISHEKDYTIAVVLYND